MFFRIVNYAVHFSSLLEYFINVINEVQVMATEKLVEVGAYQRGVMWKCWRYLSKYKKLTLSFLYLGKMTTKRWLFFIGLINWRSHVMKFVCQSIHQKRHNSRTTLRILWIFWTMRESIKKMTKPDLKKNFILYRD